METSDVFEKLFETILIDITKAQNKSNIYSAKLGEQYADPAKYKLPVNLRFCPLPAPVINSFNLNIKFALEALENYLDNTLKNETGKLVAAMIEKITQPEKQIKDKDKVIADIVFDIKQSIYKVITDDEKGSITNETLLVFFRNSFHEILSTDFYIDIINEIFSQQKANINSCINKILNRISGLKDKRFGNVSPVYDFETLNEVDAAIICTITLNVDMRNYQVGFDEPAINNNAGLNMLA